MKSVTPQFFYIFDIAKSSSYTGKSLRKKAVLENFRANVLKPLFLPLLPQDYKQSIAVAMSGYGKKSSFKEV